MLPRLHGKIVGRCGDCDGYVVVPATKGLYVLYQDRFRKAAGDSMFFRGMCVGCGGISVDLPVFPMSSSEWGRFKKMSLSEKRKEIKRIKKEEQKK